MRNIFLEKCENEEEKKLLEKFFDEIKQLHNDIDFIPYAEYQIRYRKAFDIVSKIAIKFGSYYLFNTFGLDEKARDKYKGEYVKTYRIEIPSEIDEDSWIDKIKQWFHRPIG